MVVRIRPNDAGHAGAPFRVAAGIGPRCGTEPPAPRLPGDRVAMKRLRELVRRFGALRVLLLAAVIVLIVAAPFSDGPAHATGWPLVRSVIAPTLFVIMAFVLPLDITMTLVFMSDRHGAERRRLRRIAQTESVLFVAMLLAWMPLLIRLIRTLD